MLAAPGLEDKHECKSLVKISEDSNASHNHTHYNSYSLTVITVVGINIVVISFSVGLPKLALRWGLDFWGFKALSLAAKDDYYPSVLDWSSENNLVVGRELRRA